MRYRKFAIFIIFCLITVSLFSTGMAEEAQGDLDAWFYKTPQIEVDGVKYRQRSRVTGVLLMGVDRLTDVEGEFEGFRHGGQADFLLLLVIDDDRERITPIQINRDTMAEIVTVSVLGKINGTRTAQICLSHGYGDGKEQSCEFTVQAVKKLLMDAPINHYISMNMDAIGALNDAIGGVQVTLEDDFTVYDPSMRQGEALVLRGKQAEYYLRYRYRVGDQTNLSRSKRQRNYMNAAKEKIAERIGESGGFIGELYDAVQQSVTTDMSRGYMVNMANRARNYEIMETQEIRGESRLSDTGYMEFYADADSIRDIIVDAYYEPRKY